MRLLSFILILLLFHLTSSQLLIYTGKTNTSSTAISKQPKPTTKSTFSPTSDYDFATLSNTVLKSGRLLNFNSGSTLPTLTTFAVVLLVVPSVPFTSEEITALQNYHDLGRTIVGTTLSTSTCCGATEAIENLNNLATALNVNVSLTPAVYADGVCREGQTETHALTSGISTLDILYSSYVKNTPCFDFFNFFFL